MEKALGCEIINGKYYGLQAGDLRTANGWTRNAGGEQMILQPVHQEDYIENTSKCELPYGAYHYVIAGTAARAREEARYFVEETRKAKRRPNFYIADIEHENQTETTTEPVCVAFLNELRKLGCKKIGLYINRKYKYAGKAVEMCDIMWIPHWGANNGEVPGDASKPQYPHDLWQYTSRGRVDGIDGNVDLSQMTGTKPLEYFTDRWPDAKSYFF